MCIYYTYVFSPVITFYLSLIDRCSHFCSPRTYKYTRDYDHVLKTPPLFSRSGSSSFCKYLNAQGCLVKYDDKVKAGKERHTQKVCMCKSLKFMRKYLQILFNFDLLQYIYSIYLFPQALNILTTQRPFLQRMNFKYPSTVFQ